MVLIHNVEFTGELQRVRWNGWLANILYVFSHISTFCVALHILIA